MAEQRKRSWLWLWGLGIIFFGGAIGSVGFTHPNMRDMIYSGAFVEFIGIWIFGFAVVRAIFRAIFRAAGQAFTEGAKGNH